MKRALLLAATSAFFLSFPVTAQTLTPNCAKSCVVVITMSAGCGSGIKVAPDPVVVPPGGDVDIEWRIDTAGWAFDSPNGIFIHQGGDAFGQGPTSSRSNRFKHKNKGPRAFKYDVNLVDSSKPDQPKCKLDPTIVDQ